MVVTVLFNAGDHVPIIKGIFVDEIVNMGNIPPEQIGATGLNVGVILGLTVIVNVVVVAHCPASGVKV